MQPEAEAPPRGTPGPDRGQDDIALENISKRFGEVVALHPTSLSIARGEFFSLLGASGSGKTTTLRLIGGFEEPTSGRIFLQGREVTHAAPYERNVNTVFQDYALFPHMTVEQNIGYGLRVKRVPRRDITRRVGEALDLVRLSGFGGRRPSQLSGGQRQRVALARALVNSPAVLLLDEPLGALDLKLRREMQEELRRIQRDVGITFLYVTHDQEEAMSMSDRVAVMRDGRIEQVGSATEVYERPASAFVAGFVGVSNLLNGTLGAADISLWTVDLAGGGSLQAPAGPSCAVGQPVLLTVRPEKIRMLVGEQVTPSRGNQLRGRIGRVSYGGAFTRYTVSAGAQELEVVEQNEGAGSRAQTGEEVWLSWPVDQTLVLQGTHEDLSSGQNETSSPDRAR